MVVIYSVLVEVQNPQYMQINYISIIMENVSFLQAIFCIFAPAIAADWLSSEANKLKLMLHDWLIDENGKYVL